MSVYTLPHEVGTHCFLCVRSVPRSWAASNPSQRSSKGRRQTQNVRADRVRKVGTSFKPGLTAPTPVGFRPALLGIEESFRDLFAPPADRRNNPRIGDAAPLRVPGRVPVLPVRSSASSASNGGPALQARIRSSVTTPARLRPYGADAKYVLWGGDEVRGGGQDIGRDR